MIEAPKRFNENPEKVTEIKKNGTEHFGLDQDGVAKTIAAELLLTKENVGLGKVVNKTEAELVASGAIADALALKFDKSSLADNYDGGTTKALSAEKGKDLNARVSVLEGDDETEGSVAKTVKDAVEPIDARLTGLDTLTYEGITYMVSRKIENGHLVTTYTEVA